MVEVAQTRELFSALISRPALDDRLLQRPPFKFIHDIVVETIHATGYLSSLFDADELDSRKAGLTKETKIAFIRKLVDALNAEGDLDDVSPAKIVAGKEADRTNLLLQKLAIQAAASNIDRPSKQSRDKKRNRSSSQTPADSKSDTPASREKQRHEKKKEIEKEKRRLSKAIKTDTTGIDSNDNIKKKTKKSTTEEKTKKRSEDKESKRDKSKKRSEEKTSSKEKTKKRQVKEEPDHFVDEGIGSATPHLSQRRDIASPILRESSGGTSKADDSGIADEIHESERQSSATVHAYQPDDSKTATPDRIPPKAPSPAVERNRDAEEAAVLHRPITAAGRPQTAIERPGTAAARPAPPRIKKTKIGDIDPTTITPQPATFEKSAVITEDAVADEKAAGNDNDFLLDEEDESHNLINMSNANIAADLEADEHGALVNRIVANTQKIQREAISEEFDGLEVTESKKLHAEVDACRDSLQSLAQNVQPLSRTIELVAEDFDVLLREIDESRKRYQHAQRQLAEQLRRDDGNAALLATLRQMDAELSQVRAQIAKTTASIIENERRINELMAIN